MYPESDLSKASVYQIRVHGKLRGDWADWFHGLAITCDVEDDGVPITTLTGPVVDQAALHGILAKIRDLNLKLISVVGIEEGKKEQSDD